MPLFTTKPTDQLFERFMKHQPNFKPDAPEADRIQAELDSEKEKKGRCPVIYRDDRHHHTFEKEAAMRPESISRAAGCLVPAHSRQESVVGARVPSLLGRASLSGQK